MPDAQPTPQTSHFHHRRPLTKTLIHWSRTLHIYLSVLGLFVMAFFAFTGFTAYHEDWFKCAAAEPRVYNGQTSVALLPPSLNPAGDNWKDLDFAPLQAHLKSQFGVNGELVECRSSNVDWRFDFESPDRKETWKVTLNKSSGATVVVVPPPIVLRGQTPLAAIAKPDDGTAIVAHLRQQFAVTGALRYPGVACSPAKAKPADADEIKMRFSAPGRVWDVTVNPQTGQTVVELDQRNPIGIMNDLHRGRYSGRYWGWVIDISAILMFIACVTGIILWAILPKRRQIGIAALILGIVLTIVVYAWWVPGQDAPLKRDPASQLEE